MGMNGKISEILIGIDWKIIVFEVRRESFFLTCLTPKAPRPFFCQKTLKIVISAKLAQENKEIFFLEFNCTILYLTCLRSSGKNFMKFDRIDWKILHSVQVGKEDFF